MRTLPDTANLTQEQLTIVSNIRNLLQEACKNELLADSFRQQLSNHLNGCVEVVTTSHCREDADALLPALANVATFDKKWAYGTPSDQARRRVSRSLNALLRQYETSMST